jgi:hypothetical protein
VAPLCTCMRSPVWPLLRLLLLVVTSQVLGSVPAAGQALADRVLRLSWEREVSEGLELGAGMTGTPSSEGRGAQQCVPLTRPWLHPTYNCPGNT